MDEKQTRQARLNVLGVLHDYAIKAEGPIVSASIYAKDISERSGLTEGQVKFTTDYLRQLDYVYISQADDYSITAKGIVYYEDEKDRWKKRLADWIERAGFIVLGSGITFIITVLAKRL